MGFIGGYLCIRILYGAAEIYPTLLLSKLLLLLVVLNVLFDDAQSSRESG